MVSRAFFEQKWESEQEHNTLAALQTQRGAGNCGPLHIGQKKLFGRLLQIERASVLSVIACHQNLLVAKLADVGNYSGL